MTAATVLAVVVVAGCATTQTIHRPGADIVRSLPRPAPAAAPSATLTVTVSEPSETGDALADAVSASLADALTVEGVAAPVQGNATYALTCTLQDVGVRRTRRCSDTRSYRIAADCTLSHGDASLWHDTVVQRYEERVFVNTMSKLPAGDDATWLQECFLPWRRMVVWRAARAIQRRAAAATGTPAPAAEPGAVVETPAAGSFQQ